jgi:hypothetical protein
MKVEDIPKCVLDEKEWIKARHQYHGIWYSEYEPGYGHYFIRNNRRCRL